MEVLNSLSLYAGSLWPLAGRNSEKLKVLDFLSPCGRPSLPPAARNPQKLNAAIFVLALNKARVPALNAAHVLRLNMADVLALSKAHVLRLNIKICPVFMANTKEAAFGCKTGLALTIKTGFAHN